MFVRLYRPAKGKEVLVNVNHISKIEIEYGVEIQPGSISRTSLTEGASNPDANRIYRVFVSGEHYLLPANPRDPVMKVFDDIYKSAIKGDESSEDE